MKSSTNRNLNTFYYHFIILLVGIFMFYPIVWLIASSFKSNAEIFHQAHSLIPDKIMYENYIQGWKGFGGDSFTVFFGNSFIIAITATLGQIITSSFTAYGFTRVKFIGKKFWFSIMIVTLLLPMQVLIIPQYMLFNFLGWVNTFKPLILPRFFAMPFFIFLTMQFIQGIPRELDEAAKIDGCGTYSIFFKIILPNIKPALITTGIFSFYWTWQDFLSPLLYIQSPSKYPVALALQLFSDPEASTHWGAMFAMAVLSLVPVFLIFITLQKHLVRGVTTTGID